METEGQWCDNASCPDCGKIGANNIKMHSYAERRCRCTTCHRTCSADKGTFFATLRIPRPILLDVVAMLVERNSLRAVSRIKHLSLSRFMVYCASRERRHSYGRCTVR
jgi:transposase-like protein